MQGDSTGHPPAGDSEHIEIERKFDVGPDFAVPPLAGLPGVAGAGKPRTHRLTAVYYDTDGMGLARAHITLRRRTGGTDAGWHVKLPAGEGARREVHAPLGDPAEPVPARLTELLAGHTAGMPLHPVARLETERRLYQLTGPHGENLAEVADDRVTGFLPGPAGHGARAREPGAREVTARDALAVTAPGPAAGPPPAAPVSWRELASWREVEVELGTGGLDLLEAASERLRRAGARPSASGSKLARLLTGAGVLTPGADGS